MRGYGADDVRIMPVMVPHWTRGTTAVSEALLSEGIKRPLHITALGGSIGTAGNDPIQARVIAVKHLAELDTMTRELTEGSIVLFNRPMNPVLINTGSAYGGAYDQRGNGASAAAAVGAVGALVRSLTHALDTLPPYGEP